MKAGVRHVHFVAIGGSGMGSLAGLLKARGWEVTGSDRALYPPMSTALSSWSIPVAEGFSAANVLDRPADLVVIGNAVGPDNEEARAAIDAGLAYRSFPDALYELAMAERHPVVITGTHGKTTTTSLVSYLLYAAGRDPSLLIGGISLDFGGSFREGEGPHFVVEGDEYDTAFFDKTPKFLHYHAQTLIVTSVEFDHADIYRDLDHVKSAFCEVVARMPADGTIVADVDHANVREVVSGAPCRVLGYSVAGAGDGGAAEANVDVTYARAALADELGTSFELHAAGGEAVSVRIPLHGAFNVANATAALVTVDVLGVPLAESVPLLPRFQGVKRRQEFRGEVNGVAVIDDFAHHPTAVKGSIEALGERYPQRRIIAVFEPRTNTSRRRVFQHAYVDALAAADRVLVQRVPDTPIYSATGEVTERFSADELAEGLRGRGVPTTVSSEVDEIVDALVADQRPGDVVLVMSNGAFGGIWEKLLERLKA